MAEEKPKHGKKCPTALKRVKQSKESGARNSSFKSRVRTAIRAFESALGAKDKEKMETALNSVYSLMDKGTKRGIYKKNKAARTKTRIALLQKTA
ncbi:30S ribosomal protein S20 [Candidatus Neptunochlamydia vexilliferae]|uniref:Small ribosomal subunit protein bS20 n=1 Tax=Candidatus Neptunichlamydia vexilliferae TaxID=1651774 RepID=A0ABS0B3G5_9BACT|nr:30S ribosomal protein S20 [Candidatus Neptunochlamydia vexilliferae]MBF5060291.1 30S ribosomal protein S20 [Candidatus Neptunochlamydia vexilliferae]